MLARVLGVPGNQRFFRPYCLAPADFGRSDNPIPTREADYAHHITTWLPRLQTFNTSPDNNILRPEYTDANIERGEKSLCK